MTQTQRLKDLTPHERNMAEKAAYQGFLEQAKLYIRRRSLTAVT